MMKMALRIAALFVAYGSIGLGGDYAVGLFARDAAEVEPLGQLGDVHPRSGLEQVQHLPAAGVGQRSIDEVGGDSSSVARLVATQIAQIRDRGNAETVTWWRDFF